MTLHIAGELLDIQPARAQINKSNPVSTLKGPLKTCGAVCTAPWPLATQSSYRGGWPLLYRGGRSNRQRGSVGAQYLIPCNMVRLFILCWVDKITRRQKFNFNFSLLRRQHFNTLIIIAITVYRAKGQNKYEGTFFLTDFDCVVKVPTLSFSDLQSLFLDNVADNLKRHWKGFLCLNKGIFLTGQVIHLISIQRILHLRRPNWRQKRAGWNAECKRSCRTGLAKVCMCQGVWQSVWFVLTGKNFFFLYENESFLVTADTVLISTH